MLNEELDDKERQYSGVRRRVERKSVAASGTQTIKAELEQAEDSRRAGASRWRPARMSGIRARQNSELEKQLEAATQSEGKTMRLLRNKVTDAKLPKCWRADRHSGCQ